MYTSATTVCPRLARSKKISYKRYQKAADDRELHCTMTVECLATEGGRGGGGVSIYQSIQPPPPPTLAHSGISWM